MASFADNLKRLRAEAGVTQVELARRADLTQSAISRYETGEDVPELSSLLKLATGLAVPLEPLVEGLDVKFDAVYKGLHVSITTEDDPEEDGTEPAVTSAGPLPLDVIVPGAPTVPAVADDQVPDLAATHATLTRLVSELMAVVGRLPTGSHPVARDLGSGVRPRNARRRARPRQKPATKAPPKRR